MTEVSKTDYLKRYVENDKDSERKRKKKRKITKSQVSRLKILDRDIDIKSIKFGGKDEEDDYDDAPQVAEVIDERPIEVKVKELYESTRWKKFHPDAEISQVSSNDPSKSRKIDSVDTDQDISSLRNSVNSTRGRCAKSHKVSVDDRKSPLSGKHLQNSRKHSHDADGDISPLRTSHHCIRHDSDSDNSPPLTSHQNMHSRSRHDSSSDNSPPRVRQSDFSHQSSRDYDYSNTFHKKMKNSSSPNHKIKRNVKYSETKNGKKNKDHKLKNKYDSDSDLSPDRMRNRDVTLQIKNIKHVAKHRYDSDSDLSPDRIRNRDVALCMENQKHFEKRRSDSDSDLSPYRRRNSNISPPIGNEKASALKNNSDSDFSPPRQELSDDMEISLKDGRDKPNKTLSGLKAGLQNAETLKKETQELREREKQHINKLDEELSGRNANTIIRDKKTGLKRNIEEERRVKEEEEKKVEEQQQKYAEWGKGIEQNESRQNKLSDDLYEMSKPLARYCDDDDLEERLKSVIHDEDPMSAYMRKKKKKETSDYPTYKGPPAPPNRFGISPGYRWDGVDRSNGFEKKYFEKLNSKKAVQEEAYLWSVQNM